MYTWVLLGPCWGLPILMSTFLAGYLSRWICLILSRISFRLTQLEGFRLSPSCLAVPHSCGPEWGERGSFCSYLRLFTRVMRFLRFSIGSRVFARHSFCLTAYKSLASSYLITCSTLYSLSLSPVGNPLKTLLAGISIPISIYYWSWSREWLITLVCKRFLFSSAPARPAWSCWVSQTALCEFCAPRIFEPMRSLKR